MNSSINQVKKKELSDNPHQSTKWSRRVSFGTWRQGWWAVR
jgi:hypothetical protein